MPNKVKLLVVGDIIGKGARNAFIRYIPTLKEKYNYDIIAVNAENTTHGRGLNYKHYLTYIDNKIDVLTMGNHVLDNEEIINYIDKTDNLVVPGNVNYSYENLKNHKEAIVKFKDYSIKFINILDTLNNKEKFEVIDPISYFDSVFVDDKKTIYIVDYHGEFTLRKNLFAYYVDSKVSLVYGTHTHVQTADERILPSGTGYISDVGMCGSIDSIIGYDYISFINKLKNNSSSTVSTREPLMINALLVEIDLTSKKCLSILRINEKM